MRGPLPSWLLTVLVAGSLLAACDRTGVGRVAPEVVATKVTRASFDSVQSLRGKLVLYEYFAFWCPPCAATVPHLNHLVDTYGKRGLVVVGVTKEDEAQTEAFVESTKAQYPIVYEPGMESFQKLGFKTIPHAVLVGPNRRILWKGHPMTLDVQLLEQHLAAAARPPR